MEVKSNYKFSPSITLSTFQVLKGHMWPMLDGANIEHFVLGRDGAVDKTVCPLDSPVVFFFFFCIFFLIGSTQSPGTLVPQGLFLFFLIAIVFFKKVL